MILMAVCGPTAAVDAIPVALKGRPPNVTSVVYAHLKAKSEGDDGG